MKKLKIEPGDRFGKWTIIEEVPSKIISGKPRRMFKCQCDCGNTKEVQLACLRNKHSTSCGCEQKKRASEAQIKHGLCDKHPLYNVWKNIKKRCNYPNAQEYDNYGGRGIMICNEWSNDFKNFYNWAINNGWASGLSIDRIDNDGNYCPENCRWATAKIQMNNTTKNHNINYQDKVFTLATLAEHLNIPYNIVRYRISRCNWTVERLINYYNDRNKSK